MILLLPINFCNVRRTMREQKDRYEIFLKVCETGSFSKAAEALNYTQSGISQMMAALEEELEGQLFARVNRGVPTTAPDCCLTSGRWLTRKPGYGRQRSISTTKWRAPCEWAVFPASRPSGCRRSSTILRRTIPRWM